MATDLKASVETASITSVSSESSITENAPTIVKRLDFSRAKDEWFDRIVKDGDNEVTSITSILIEGTSLLL